MDNIGNDMDADEGRKAQGPSPPPSAYQDVVAVPSNNKEEEFVDIEAGGLGLSRRTPPPSSGELAAATGGGGGGGGGAGAGAGAGGDGNSTSRRRPPRSRKISLKSEAEMWWHVRLETALLKRHYHWIVGCVVMEWVHLTAHNFIYFLEGKVWGNAGPPPPLKDLGLMLLADRLPSNYEWIVGLSTCILVGMLLVLGMARLTLNNVNFGGPQLELISRSRGEDGRILGRVSMPMPVILVLSRSCKVVCIALALRVMTFMVTLLPNPAEYCHGAGWDPPHNVFQVFARISVTGSCGDLLFSGHTSHGMVLMLIILRYSPKVKAARALAISSMTVLVLSLLAFKAHYSSDVLVAIYVTIMIWRLVPPDPSRMEVVDLKMNGYVPSSSSVSTTPGSALSSPGQSDDGTERERDGRRVNKGGGEEEREEEEEGKQGRGKELESAAAEPEEAEAEAMMRQLEEGRA